MNKKEIFIEKSKVIHNDKYDYSKVEYTNNKNKVEVICKEHGSFYIRPNCHLNNRGCPKCGIKMGSEKRKNKNWLQDCLNVHGDRYDYTNVCYINSKTKVEIICKEHGPFFMKLNAHIYQKQNCPRCQKKVFNTNDFIKESTKIHDNIYNYSKVNYISCNLKVEIICNKHGSFFMRPSDHVNSKQGCPKCGKENMSKLKRKDIDILLEEFIKLNGDLYDYSLINYFNNNTKVDIICKEHGVFKQTPKSHLKGNGCPRCKSSKGERRIISFLTEKNIDFIFQKKFDECLSKNKLSFDFYLSEQNICIEYDGDQHFKPINYFGGIEQFNKQKQNDKIKNKYCLDNKIKLIRIPFYKYDEIEKILTFELNL